MTHNDERIAARSAPKVRDETRAAKLKLDAVMPYMFDWYKAMGNLVDAEPSDATTAELLRVTQLGAIVGNLITEARSHTREAGRISQQAYPVPDRESETDAP